jgi:hypothetical protein
LAREAKPGGPIGNYGIDADPSFLVPNSRNCNSPARLAADRIDRRHRGAAQQRQLKENYEMKITTMLEQQAQILDDAAKDLRELLEWVNPPVEKRLLRGIEEIEAVERTLRNACWWIYGECDTSIPELDWEIAAEAETLAQIT